MKIITKILNPILKTELLYLVLVNSRCKNDTKTSKITSYIPINMLPLLSKYSKNLFQRINTIIKSKRVLTDHQYESINCHGKYCTVGFMAS